MKNVTESINSVLADWNPIGVDFELANEEYRRYIPLILRYATNKQKLLNYLEDIFVKKMELGYDPQNEEHSKDLQEICNRIMQAYKKANAS